MVEAQLADVQTGFFVVLATFVDPVAEEGEVDLGDSLVVDLLGDAADFLV